MIRIVTDTTGYLPADILEKYHIPLVPLKVQFGQESYDEVVGISNRDFYRRLTASAEFPTTSQPAAGEFAAVYQQILAETPQAEILTLALSSGLSGTYNSALVAAEQFPQANITVFDTLSTVTGLGLMVLNTAEMVEQGQSLAAILDRLAYMRDNTHIIFMVDSLEHLRRGGRINTAAAFLGTLLHTKPILALVQGKIEPVDRVRTKKKALDRLFAILEQQLPRPDYPVQAGVMHIGAEADMISLSQRMRDCFQITRLFNLEIGPVIGAHVGPGTLGAGFCLEPNDA